MICNRCKKEHNGTYGSGKFCSINCAMTRVYKKGAGESKQKTPHKNIGRIPWNKGKPGSMSAEARLKIKNTMIGKYSRGEITLPPHKLSKMIVHICPACLLEYTVPWHKRYKKYCSKACWNKCSGGYRSNSTRKIRSEYKGYWMDSGSERTFAELMDLNSIKWIKNTTKCFDYRDITGKARKYYPDFYLPDYDYWVEIKGLYYLNENDPLKLKSVGNNIEMQMHTDIGLPKCIKRLL